MARKTKQERWTADRARAELERCEASGLSLAGYCRREKIRPKRLYWWRHRLEASPPKPDALIFQRPTLVEATITGAQDSRVVVQLRGGERIEVEDPERLDPGWLILLARGLSALEG